MKAIILFTLILFSTGSALFAQSGYFGRKIMVEVGGIGRIPAVYNRFGSEPYYYEGVGGSLRRTNNQFDFGFLGGVSLLSKKSVSFGIYGGMYSTISKSDYPGSYASYPIDGAFIYVDKMESFQLKTINIQPTLIISNERFTKPAGLSHEIGFGFQMTHMVPKDYIVLADAPENQATIDANKSLIYNKNAKYRAIGLTYTLKIKKPLSDRMFLSYGLRYNLTIGNMVDVNGPVKLSSNYGDDNLRANVRKSLNQQFLNLFVGLAFML